MCKNVGVVTALERRLLKKWREFCPARRQEEAEKDAAFSSFFQCSLDIQRFTKVSTAQRAKRRKLRKRRKRKKRRKRNKRGLYVG